jgi:hypothetical protein
MEFSNWVASCIDELDDTLSRFTGVQYDSVRATHSVSAKAHYNKNSNLGKNQWKLPNIRRLWLKLGNFRWLFQADGSYPGNGNFRQWQSWWNLA